METENQPENEPRQILIGRVCKVECYTFRQIIFFTSEHKKKKAHEPLQLLGSLPISFVHQMLHQCNIFKGLTAP